MKKLICSLLTAALLAAPVLSEGAAEREVYLPDGEWRDFYTGERLQGNRTYIRECAEEMPVFVLEGAENSLLLPGPRHGI